MGNKQPAFTTIDNIKSPKSIIIIVIIIALFSLPLFVKSSYILHIIIMMSIYTIVTVSFRTINTSGQFALAHAGYMGIGAYLAGITSKFLGWQPCITIPVAALAASGIGMLIGYPFSRLRTLYYALGSLFFGLAIVNIILALRTYTGGSTGLSGIQPMFDTLSKVPYYYFFIGLMVVSLLILYRFEHCRIGTHLKAIDQSYFLASSVGINESRYRIMVLGVGCFFAGLVGASYAHYATVLSYNTFGLGATLWIVTYSIIGGIGSFYGPIIGTVLLMLIPEVFHSLKLYTPYISAAMLLLIVYLMPNGLVGLPQSIRSWRRKQKEGEEITHVA